MNYDSAKYDLKCLTIPIEIDFTYEQVTELVNKSLENIWQHQLFAIENFGNKLLLFYLSERKHI